jgi:hypothetical protein
MTDFPAHVFAMDGEPTALHSSASKWSSFATAASDAGGAITRLDTTEFVGPEGDLFRRDLSSHMPRHLQIAGEAFSKVSMALTGFASTLESLQDQMRPLAQRAPTLWQAVQAAQGRLDRAGHADKQHERDVANRPAETNPPNPPDTYHSDTGSASAALSQAQREWQNCVEQANELRLQLKTAVHECARVIVEAKGMRFKENPKSYDVGGQYTNFVRDNKEALKELSGALKVASTISGSLSFADVLAPVGDWVVDHAEEVLHVAIDVLEISVGVELLLLGIGMFGTGLVVDLGVVTIPIGAAVDVAAVGVIIGGGALAGHGAVNLGKDLHTMFAEHRKGKRKSTQPKHEKGDERRGRDQGNEKGDKRRRGNPNKRHR